jgi:hypothetical protein
VPKVQHKPIKRSKLGFKKKGAKEIEENPGLAHRTVRCATGQCPVPRTVWLQTCHVWVSGEPLRYNSPVCLVCHRTVRCTSGATARQRNGRLQRSSDNAQCADSSRIVRAAARRRTGQWTVPVWCGTGLPGAPRSQSSNGRNHQNPNGWVTWLAHRTLSGAPIDNNLPQRLNWWLGL